MLRKEAVEKGTMDLVDKLIADDKPASFDLAGGIALALKIGLLIFAFSKRISGKAKYLLSAFFKR